MLSYEPDRDLEALAKEMRDLFKLSMIERKGVTFAFDDFDLRIDAGATQFGVQSPALIDRDEPVPVAVIDEKWGCMPSDMRDGAGLAGQVEPALNISAEHLVHDAKFAESGVTPAK